MHWFKKKSRTSVIVPDRTDEIIQIPEPESVHEKKNCCQRCCTKENLQEQALLIATIVSVVLGAIVGVALREIKCPTGKNK